MKRESSNFISMKRFCVGASLCCLVTGAQAAPTGSAFSERFNVEFALNQVTLKNVVDLLKQQTDVVFSYDTSLESLKVNSVSVKAKNESLETVLEQALKGTGINYKIEDHIVVLYAANTSKVVAKANIAQQSTKITGIVKDATGEPVIGANVVVKGTTNGIITGLDGDFSIEAPANAILVVSYIGYTPQEISVNGKTVLNILLKEDAQKLDEVVVTALGIKRQAKSIGYSTTKVGGDSFTESRDLNLGNALSGKISGVSVSGNATGMGGSSRVVIRGNASLTGNNQPLYVIDGVPFDNTNQGSAGTWGGFDMGDGLSNVSPDDIAEVQVLKGAAASALYGYRGGNGAILITTKSGKKGENGFGIEVNNNLTFNTIYDYRDFQDVYGQGSMGAKPTTKESAIQTYASSWGAKMDGSDAVNFLGNTYKYSNINNWKNFYRVGVNDQASVAVSGKSDKISYRFGISNMYDRSNLPNSNMGQQGINMNTTYDISSKLHLTVNANYVFEKFTNRANLSDGNGNANATLLYLANTNDVRWMEPRVDANNSELIPGDNVYFNNPYFLQYDKTNTSNKNRLTGAMTLKYDIFDWLYAQGQVTRDGYGLEMRQVQPAGAAADPSGWLNEYSKNYSEMNLSYLIGFDKKLNDFSINATLGGNRQRNITKLYGTDGGIRPFLVPGFNSASNIGNRVYKKEYTEYRVNSVYATADFGFKDYLYLNFTGRNDWFSTLSPENNHYFYPSVSASFVFSDAFKMPEWIYSGKVRASYASASNGTSAYQNYLTYKLKDFKIQGQSIGEVNNGNVPNANLKPVRIQEWEAGLNVQFLDNRLGLDLAVYKKKTTDDIAMVSTSSASGYSSAIMNVGEIQNTGVEAMIHAVPVRTNGFIWNTSFNIAYNNSEVIYLGEGVDNLSIDGASARSGGVTIQNIVGSSYGQIVGYKYKRDGNGNVIFKDGLPEKSDQVESLGSGVYKVTGGFHNDFSYKNFTLSFLLDFKFGAKLFSGTNLNLYNYGLQKTTLQGRDGNGTYLGQGVMYDKDKEAYVPNTVAVNAQDYWQKLSSSNIGEEFVYDASFIKLRELSFGYSFPASILQNRFVKGLSISLVGRNLWTIMKHTPNIDPESAYNNTNGQGLELNGYPATRSVGFNVNVKF